MVFRPVALVGAAAVGLVAACTAFSGGADDTKPVEAAAAEDGGADAASDATAPRDGTVPEDAGPPPSSKTLVDLSFGTDCSALLPKHGIGVTWTAAGCRLCLQGSDAPQFVLVPHDQVGPGVTYHGRISVAVEPDAGAQQVVAGLRIADAVGNTTFQSAPKVDLNPVGSATRDVDVALVAPSPEGRVELTAALEGSDSCVLLQRMILTYAP